MPILVRNDKSGAQQSWPVADSRMVIGRSADNDVVLDDVYVSRQHAVVQPTASGYTIRDLGSKNGTWINGARLGPNPHRLADGDAIAFGNSAVSLVFVGGDTTVTFAMGGPASGFRVDAAGREVYLDGSALSPPLSRKEFDILSLLWEHKGQACSRDEMAARGWPERPDGDVSDAEIEQYVRRLRRRLGDDGKNPILIQTVRRFGYKMP